MQTRIQSVVEGAVNTILGFGIACAGNLYFGLPLKASFYLTFWLTIISFLRGLVIRRLFNWWQQ